MGIKKSTILLTALCLCALVCCNQQKGGAAPDSVKTAACDRGDCFTDSRDGQRYRTVKIGKDVWMAENLNYKTEKSWCHNYRGSSCETYGRLYSFRAAATACPDGWHLPSDGEWGALVQAAGGERLAGENLKSKAGWNDASDGASGNGTDELGFSALPAGYRDPSLYRDFFRYGRYLLFLRAILPLGSFAPIGHVGNWWSMPENSGSPTYRALTMSYYNPWTYGPDDIDTHNGENFCASVRCIRDGSDNNAGASGSGDSTSASAGDSTGAANSARDSSFTDARDKQKYRAVHIGEQVWMAENLNYNAKSSWCYQEEASRCEKSGRLYDFETAMKACPAGWRLPDREDWDNLMVAAGGVRDSLGPTSFRYGLAGKRLKSKTGWPDVESNLYRGKVDRVGSGTDEFGFSAIPGGGGGANTRPFILDGPPQNYTSSGLWWSATEYSCLRAYRWGMDYAHDDVYESDRHKNDGFSVRCVAGGRRLAGRQQKPPLQTVRFTVSFSASGGKPDTISPVTVVNCGQTLGKRMPPNPTLSGYAFSGWFDHFTDIANDTEYTANTVITHDVKLYARWKWIPVPGRQFNQSTAYSSFKDARDGKSYRKVKIGKETWMAENLNYETGNSWCYGDKKSNCAVYGRLYDWNTATAACPSGWHLPYNKEWAEMVNLAGGWRAAGKLASKIGWSEYTDAGDDEVTDEYGFSALPGGIRGKAYAGVPAYGHAGQKAYFWSATEWRVKLGPDSPDNADIWTMTAGIVSGLAGSEKENGLSVRCVEGAPPPPPKPQVAEAQPPTSFKDERDGKTYKAVKIGKGTWMAENLNYKIDSSWCYDNDESKCQTYGRLYTWGAAMKACPAGWHLPDTADWNRLIDAVGRYLDGKKLKSKTGWYTYGDSNYNGTDTHGFSGLPGGQRHIGWGNYRFGRIVHDGYFWLATDDGDGDAYYRNLTTSHNVQHMVGEKGYGNSVRCVRD